MRLIKSSKKFRFSISTSTFNNALCLFSVVISSLLISIVYGQPQPYQIDGTTGAPLGGIGAGAVKFCAHNGNFGGSFRTPCCIDKNFTGLTNGGFQFFSKRGSTVAKKDLLTSVITGGRSDDDAVYPVQFANFGTINSVSIKLTAFTPFDLSNVDLMCYPYAFFQLAVTNTDASSSVDAAVAFQAGFLSMPDFVPNKGIKNEGNNIRYAIYVTSDDPALVISGGATTDAGFASSGVCSNTTSGLKNMVSAKVTLGPGETKLLKFVFAWNNKATGDEGSKDGMFYYLNKFKPDVEGSAGATADTGLAHFDQLRDNATNFVNRVRASNFPDWIENQALVTLCNLTNNSMYRQDGRYAHTEGMWNTNGTMDQMFHARQIYGAILPELNWRELEYWARTQKINPVGQIHHDLCSLSDAQGMAWSRNVKYMCAWDAQQHNDYLDNINQWVDLNCAFIISIYEAFIATADTTKLNYFWPYVKKAGQRMMDQLADYNNASKGFAYIYNGTLNTYDANANQDMSAYNVSLAALTYKVLSILASYKNDPLKPTYDKYFDSTSAQFQRYYFTASRFPTVRVENVMTGQWLAYYLKFGEIFDSTNIDFALNKLESSYQPLKNGLGKSGYDEWSEYLVAHYGGLSLQTGRDAEWQGLQKDWYERTFFNRNLVYNIELGIPVKVTNPVYLATSFNCFNQYISAPVVWRNYYTMVGYQRNKFTKELWLEPTIPTTFTEMNHQIINAVVFSPEGPAKINFKESGTGYKVQDIRFTPDLPVEVSSIYVKDRGLSKNYVKVNGTPVEDAKIKKVGTGYAKVLKIDYQGTVPANGIGITVSDDPNFESSISPVVQDNGKTPNTLMPVFSANIKSFSITTVASKPYHIEVYCLNGKTIQKHFGFGKTEIHFGMSAKNEANRLPAGIYLVKAAIGKTLASKSFVLTR